MNRIILIGNGFDLAHKLKTSYKDFIDDYWSKVVVELSKLEKYQLFENEDLKIANPATEYEEKSFNEINEKIRKFKSEHKTGLDFSKLVYVPDYNFFKNDFLKQINEKNNSNWVDIEYEYYKSLKKSYDLNNEFRDIDKLNNEFENIKDSLIKYIADIETKFNNNPKKINEIGKKIYYPLLPNDLNSNGLNSLVEFIENEIIKYREQNDYESKYINVINNVLKLTNDSALKSEIKNLLLSHSVINNFNLIPDNTLFLTFNYTNTHYLYEDASQFDTFYKQIYTKRKDIKIHGSIKIEDKNPIIFGYGDELDDEYKNIEKLNDNRFLENIKSIKYSETDNYKKTIEFIESDVFQVFIMGHSCGISDRTLLNTIFEHDNCVSIKPFYYKKEDGSDNYSDLVRNISRNFNDKIKMRDRVVNKEYSEPLN